jgi:hypothetical protein
MQKTIDDESKLFEEDDSLLDVDIVGVTPSRR